MTTQELVERLRAIDRYLTSLWDHAALLRANHSGQAHADLNDLRHGIGAIPDGLAEAASRLSEMDAENKRLREALREIAKQVPAKDMDEDYYEAADFEDGYDRCVFAARAALEHQP